MPQDILTGITSEPDEPKEPEAPPKPLYKPAPTKDVALRARSFGMRGIQRKPVTAAWAVGTSQIKDHRMPRFGGAVTSAAEWQDELTSFGGVPGALSDAYDKSLTIGDEPIRRASTDILDAMRRLTPETQAAIAPILLGTGRVDASSADAIMESLFGPETEVTTEDGQQVVNVEDSRIKGMTTDHLAALHLLFPDFVIRFKESYSVQDYANDYADELYSRSGSLRGLIDVAAEIPEGKLSYKDAFTRVVTSSLGVFPELGWGIAGDIGRSNSVTRGLTNSLDDRLGDLQDDIFGMTYDPETGEVTGMGWGLQIIALGLDPNDPEFDQQLADRGAMAVIAGGALGSGLGRLGRKAKIARTAISKAVAEERLAATLSRPRTGIIGTAAEAYRAPLRAVGKRVNDQMLKLARDPEAFFADGISGRHGRRMLDAIDNAHQLTDNIDEQVGYLTKLYPGMNPTLARNMLEAGDRSLAKRIFVAAASVDPHAYTERLVRNNDRIIELRRALKAKREQLESRGVASQERVNEINELIDSKTVTIETSADLNDGMSPRTASRLVKRLEGAEEIPGAPEGTRMYVRRGSPTSPDDRTFILTDEQGNVLSYREVAEGKVLAETLQGENGKGYGKALGLAHWADEGITDLASPEAIAKLKEMIGRQEFSESGGALNKSMIRTLSEGTPNAANPTLQDLNEIARMRLEIYQRQRFTDLEYLKDPLENRPRQSAVRNVLAQAPQTRLQKFMSAALAKGNMSHGQVLDFNKFVDDMATRPELFTPGLEDTPLDYVAQNAETLTNYLRRAGVERRVVDRVVGKASRVKSRVEWYDFIEHEVFGPDGAIAEALQRQHVDPDLIKRIIMLHDSNPSERYYGTVYGREDGPLGPSQTATHVISRELEDGSLIPQPSRPSEFLARDITLPSVDLLIEANSLIRRTLRRAEQGGWAGKAGKALLWDTPKAVLDTVTKIMKPAVMVVRFPAMGLRIQLEQSFRMTAAGYRPFFAPEGITILPGGIPIPFAKRKILGDVFGENGWRLLDPDPDFPGAKAYDSSELGMFMDMQDENPTVRVTEDMGEVNARRVPPQKRHYKGVEDELNASHGDWLDRMLVGSDLDAEAVLRAMEAGGVGKKFLYDIDPVLRESTLWDNALPEAEALHNARLRWLENRVEYLKQLTGGDADLLSYIHTGRMRDLESPDVISELRYLSYKRELSEINDEMRTLRRTNLTDTDIVLRRALADAKKDAQARIRRLEERYPALELGGVIPDTKLRTALEEKFNAGAWNFPPKVRTPRTFGEWGGGQSALETIQGGINGFSSVLYRGLKPLGWADRHGTRGSMYHQAYTRFHAEYKARGYADSDARALAYVRATRETRDLMYDLNARTSVQRALKDIFWFLPATQEVLYTWLVKLPSKSYWPIGAAKLTAQGAMLLYGLQQLGVIETDSRGEKVIRAPMWASPIIEAVLPGKLPEGGLVFGKLEGLNLVTQNSGLPGLSTGGNFLLGKAALNWGGPFKALSDVFQPYGPETSILPQPITFLHEAVFGEAPDFEFMSGDHLEASWDRSQDQAVQYAYSMLWHENVRPPRVEDFGEYNEAQDRYVLTSEQEDKYRKARDEYLNTLLEEARSISQGVAWVRLIGSTVAPMSLYVTSAEKENWQQFWRDVVGDDYEGGGLTEQQRTKIDNYLGQHPSSLAYSVYTSMYGKKHSELPFDESQDDAFFDSYYTGARTTLSPEEYSENLMAMESRRFYAAQQRTALQQISPTLDPWEIIRHGYEKTDAITDFKESYDRYLALQDPRVKGRLDAQYELWAIENDVPVQTFEAERLAEFLDLSKQISPMLSGDEAYRPGEVKAIAGQVAALYSEEGQFGEPRTEAEKATGWWFENVFQTYLDRTAPLYAEAQSLSAQGNSEAAGAIYDQIRQIQNESPAMYKGKAVPTVEEFFYGNRSRAEQEIAERTWASRPITWLSDFQREKVGYDISTQDAAFLDDLSSLDNSMWDYIKANDVSSSSTLYDDILAARDDQAEQLARDHGGNALDLLRLNDSQPYVRLAAAGFMEGNDSWAGAMQAAGSVIKFIEDNGYSVKGFSQDYALPAKEWFYGTLNELRSLDPEFDAAMDELRRSFPLPQGYPREGAPFYEAVFFGSFNEDYIPDELVEIGEG